jgi:hypothetical protein
MSRLASCALGVAWLLGSCTARTAPEVDATAAALATHGQVTGSGARVQFATRFAPSAVPHFRIGASDPSPQLRSPLPLPSAANSEPRSNVDAGTALFAVRAHATPPNLDRRCACEQPSPLTIGTQAQPPTMELDSPLLRELRKQFFGHSFTSEPQLLWSLDRRARFDLLQARSGEALARSYLAKGMRGPAGTFALSTPYAKVDVEVIPGDVQVQLFIGEALFPWYQPRKQPQAVVAAP